MDASEPKQSRVTNTAIQSQLIELSVRLARMEKDIQEIKNNLSESGDKVISFDWRAKTNGHGDSDWLAPGEMIVSYVITVDDGLTLLSSSQSNGIVTAWLSGGEVGKWYKVACKITTNMGRIDERTLHIFIENK